jgi:6-phosphogluconolactonase
MNRIPFLCSLALVASLAFSTANTSTCEAAEKSASKGSTMAVYFGTYTQGNSKGIYRSTLDMKSGRLSKAKLVAETVNPSFLAFHPNGKFLYAVNEVAKFQGEAAGAVSAFAIDAKSGGLTFLNQESSRGAAPCHLVVDATGRNVLVANYTGGSVAVLPVSKNGRISKSSAFVQHKGSSANPQRQSAPHGHSINLDKANKFAFAADLGLDKVIVYLFDSKTGTLSTKGTQSASLPPGSGPRHFAFHPNGRNAYVINEMTRTVTAFSYEVDCGKLTTLHSLSTVPKGWDGGGSTAEVQVHPSGKFVYGSNRGHDSIAAYTVDEKTGKLTSVGQFSTQGKTPRNFGIDPTGTYLLAANQGSDSIVVFRINKQTGALEATGQKIEVPKAVCVKFLAK